MFLCFVCEALLFSSSFALTKQLASGILSLYSNTK
jgi:hypothetical protein